MSNFWENKNVSITGGDGFLGKYVRKKLEQRNCKKISVVDHKKYNLVDIRGVKRMYDDQKPDIVFHLAALVGGIEVNQKNPGKFFYENAMINLQVIHGAYLNKVEKIISTGTVSVYPKNAPLPFSEKDIRKGFPDVINAPYGIAKRIMHVQSTSYRKQYGFNSILLILTNLYGPQDNFNPETSHVVAALIKRFYDAKINNEKEVIVWGNGESTRDFCYVEDIAEGIILAAEKYNKSDPINLASGKEIKVKKIALLIKKKIGYEGNIVWDNSKPAGSKRRKININKAKNEFSYKVTTSLEEGIQKTIDWYIKKN